MSDHPDIDDFRRKLQEVKKIAKKGWEQKNYFKFEHILRAIEEIE